MLEGKGETWAPPRIVANLEQGGWIRFMPASAKGFVGLRVYSVGGAAPIMYFLWDGQGNTLAMMDALGIRDIRTGAIGAVGAKYLAREDASIAGIIGSGSVARHGLLSLAVVKKLRHIKVFSPNEEHRTDFARDISAETGVDVEPVGSPQEAVRGVDVIVTGAGRHDGPVLCGEWLEPGMCVMGIGAKDELDDDAVTRSNKVVIDSKAQFTYECKDITDQIEKGLLTWDDVAELDEVVVGDRPGRESPNEITLLKTTGTALQDLLPAIALYQKAVEIGAGQEMGDLFPRAHGWWPAPQRA
jgi:ornithine cyclodeaminase/alanine dehydrogenase-like protein (mu-crystallin family)